MHLNSLLLTFAATITSLTPSHGHTLPHAPAANACKLRYTSASLTEGFGSPQVFAPSVGTLHGKMIFVDFPDVPANDTTASLFSFFHPGAADWYRAASFGALTLTMAAEQGRFFRMPAATDTYGFNRSLSAADHRRYIDDALRAAGKGVSFAGTDVLYVVADRNAANITFSPEYDAPVTAADGTRITRTVTVGLDAYLRWGSKVLNHETGHAMGLPDLYPYSGGTTTQWIGGFDMMGLISGVSPDYLAWHKWKLGWVTDEQMACVQSGTKTFTLSPVEVKGGLKGVVMKVNETYAVVAEARVATGLDSAACAEGVLVYTVDTTINSGEGPVKVIDATPGSGGCAADELNDAPFTTKQGSNSYVNSALGITITVQARTGNNFTIAAGFH